MAGQNDQSLSILVAIGSRVWWFLFSHIYDDNEAKWERTNVLVQYKILGLPISIEGTRPLL